MIIWGIDPGLNGAMVALEGKDILAQKVLHRIEKELDLEDLRTTMLNWGLEVGAHHVYIEKTGAMPGQGVSSMFKFGKVCGQIEGFVSCLGLSYTMVSPRTWQKVAHAGVTGKNAKAKSKLACNRIFAGQIEKQHDGIYDAALIAYYGMSSR